MIILFQLTVHDNEYSFFAETGGNETSDSRIVIFNPGRNGDSIISIKGCCDHTIGVTGNSVIDNHK